MLLILQKYQLNVYYKPGNELLIADALSRDYESATADDKHLSDELLKNDSIFEIIQAIQNIDHTEDILLKSETQRKISAATLKST